MKVVYNASYGGFSLSSKAVELINERKGNVHVDKYSYTDAYGDFKRHDPDLVAVVEQLGKEAYDKYTYLAVREISDSKYHLRS